MSETDNVAAGHNSQAQVLVEHVKQGVSTATELVKAMGVSKSRISRLATKLLKEKKLVKRGRKYSLPGTGKLIPEFAPSEASQPAPVKDPTENEGSKSQRPQAKKFQIPNSCEL
jgi:hypothetical protein